MEDTEILELFFARSEEALSRLDRRWGAACRRLAENILGSTEEAEECVSDAYLAVWDAIPPQRPQRLGAWVLRVVRNRALSRREANAAAKRDSAYDAALDELSETLAAPGGPEESLAAAELTACIDRFLAGLDPVDRRLFLRRYYFGDSVKDAAAAAGMTPNRASVRLHRLRLRLRDELRKEGYEL